MYVRALQVLREKCQPVRKKKNGQKFQSSQHINAGQGEDADADQGR